MYCVFPLQRTSEQWLQSQGSVVLTWSIFNPNGPTISCLGFRETGARNELEVFSRWLHFLGGEDYCLGYVKLGGETFGADLAEVLQHAFALEPGLEFRRFPLVASVPHVVLPWIDEAWLSVLRDLIASSRAMREADWGRERYMLAKYGPRLFERAGEETREGYEAINADPQNKDEAGQQMLRFTYAKHEHIPSFRDWQPGQYQSRPLQEGDVDTWWSIVADEKFWPAAAAQLAQAWVGAAEQCDLEVKTSLEEVRDFFRHYRYPWWPDTMTTESVSRGMGLSGRTAVKAAGEPMASTRESNDAAPSVRARLSSAVRGLFGTRTRH